MRHAQHKRNKTRAPLIIGDSVLLGAMKETAAAGFDLNTRGCRQWGEGMGVLRSYKRAGRLPHLVVMELGTDWTVSVREIRAAMALLGPDRVLGLMTPREVGGYGGSDAAHMREVAKRFPDRTVLLDWVAYTRGRGSWFQPDGIHLTLAGAAGFGEFLRPRCRSPTRCARRSWWARWNRQPDEPLARRGRRRRPAAARADRAGARRRAARVDLRRGRGPLGAAGGNARRATASARGDVVLTLIGNRPDWVLTMVACLRIGAVVLPCTEQLRAKDLRLRLEVAQPKLIVADERNREQLAAAQPACPVLYVPDEKLYDAQPAPPADLAGDEPALLTFTSGTAGEPKCVVHGGRYVAGQRVQAEHWLGAQPGDLVWCTASSGWSKSARNVFIAPWIRGAAALLHDARFDPDERLELLARERVNVLCMAPTEYRVIAKRAQLRGFDQLRGMVAAGEALNPEVLHAWHEATGLWIRDGYGQTETGQTTGMPIGEPARPGSMGRPLPGVKLWVAGRRAGRRPAHGADVLPRLPRRGAPRPHAFPGTPAIASARTTTATCTSRAAPTT